MKRQKPNRFFRAGKFSLDLNQRTHIMGVLNVTPDSFSDGGRYHGAKEAVRRAIAMAAEGADIIDVGGESTRPGAAAVSEREEMRRVIPVIEKLVSRLSVPISVDTRKPVVARAAVETGASIINDVSSLVGGDEIARIAARSGAALILMHMKGRPSDMQKDPAYKDVIAEISKFLKISICRAKEAGVPNNRIAVDPGIGFGKSVEHNLEIINRLCKFNRLGVPVCIGTSRKSFIGKVLGQRDPTDRLAGTIASLVLSIAGGAVMIRVHDVKDAVGAARVADSIIKERVI